MRRKLIQHGLSSLTVSLPRKWVKNNGLEKGNEVEVDESNGKIVVSTQKHYEHKRIDIDVSNSQPMLRKIIGAAFKSGYDDITIKFSTHEELKGIQNLVREQFSGFEIVDQSRDRITIKSVTQTSFEEFNNILRRLFFVVNNIASEICNATDKDDFKWLKNITLIKVQSDKYADYCRRAINMGFEGEFKRTAPLYTIVEQLEKSADRYRDISEYMSENKIKVSDEIKSVMRELLKFQESFCDIFYKFDLSKMVEFGKSKEALQKRLDHISTQCSKKEMKVVILLNRILNLIFDLNGPMMATRL
jgi:phosphate uptake regulator